MKIIDAHLHFVPENPYFQEIAVRAEHKNTEEDLRASFLPGVPKVLCGDRPGFSRERGQKEEPGPGGGELKAGYLCRNQTLSRIQQDVCDG